MSIWPFIIYFIYVLGIEIFINVRLDRLQHALRIIIITEVKKETKKQDLVTKYTELSFIKMLKPLSDDCPVFLRKGLEQQRRTAGLRLMLHLLGLIGTSFLIVLL